MTPERFIFLAKWVFPPVMSAIAFGLVFIYNIGKDLLNGTAPNLDMLLAFSATVLAGAFAGLTYAIVRPQLRKLGRHLGDALTGAVMICIYFLSVYAVIEPDGFMQEYTPEFGKLLLFMAFIGALGGWLVNITNAEHELMQYLEDMLAKEEE